MGTLGIVLRQLGDPRQWTLPAEALALLEPLGPRPRSSGRSPRWPRAEALQGRSEEAVRYAERALGLAEELGLRRPARALGFRAWPAPTSGTPAGLEDFREAIALATEAGQGREVALLHNNLGLQLWRSKARRRAWRSCGRGSRSPEPGGSPRWSRL